HPSSLARQAQRLLEIRVDPGQTLEVALDVFRGLGQPDSQLARQSLWPHPVDDAKVYDLGQAPPLGIDLLGPASQDLGRSARMDVLAAAKGVDQRGVAGEMGEHAQVNLRIIG